MSKDLYTEFVNGKISDTRGLVNFFSTEKIDCNSDFFKRCFERMNSKEWRAFFFKYFSVNVKTTKDSLVGITGDTWEKCEASLSKVYRELFRDLLGLVFKNIRTNISSRDVNALRHGKQLPVEVVSTAVRVKENYRVYSDDKLFGMYCECMYGAYAPYIALRNMLDSKRDFAMGFVNGSRFIIPSLKEENRDILMLYYGRGKKSEIMMSLREVDIRVNLAIKEIADIFKGVYDGIQSFLGFDVARNVFICDSRVNDLLKVFYEGRILSVEDLKSILEFECTRKNTNLLKRYLSCEKVSQRKEWLMFFNKYVINGYVVPNKKIAESYSISVYEVKDQLDTVYSEIMQDLLELSYYGNVGKVYSGTCGVYCESPWMARMFGRYITSNERSKNGFALIKNMLLTDRELCDGIFSEYLEKDRDVRVAESYFKSQGKVELTEKEKQYLNVFLIHLYMSFEREYQNICEIIGIEYTSKGVFYDKKEVI